MVFSARIKHLSAALMSLLLAMLGFWVLTYGREQRHLFYKDYAFSAQEAERLSRHPDVLYVYGLKAEGGMDAAGAADYYGRVVARDPLHMDAWLRLADLRAAVGGLDQARRITAFCGRIVAPVVRWKWRLSLLAHGLDLEEILYANINFMVARRIKLDDALFLLENRLGADAGKSLAVLAPSNRAAYLQWAVRWQRDEAARAAWADMAADGPVDKGVLVDYVHFLIARKQVPEARAVWQRFTSSDGMTNAGFDEEPTGRGFDWIVASDRSGNWKVERAAGQGRDGGSGLRVSFAGRENVAFQHVRQIVPVEPGTACRVHFWWKSQGLTTDQTPFVEVYGYDAAGLYARSEAPAADSREWQPASLAFTPPAGCNAVVVRLRRLPSKRFDSRIQGSLWLDDFRVERVSGVR